MLIQNLINYAFENNAFYRRIYSEHGIKAIESKSIPLIELPFVDKQMLQQNGESVISIPYTTYPLSNNLYVLRSSGSTGQYLKIHWDNRDRVFSLLPSWNWRKQEYQITPRDSFLHFYSSLYQSNRFVDNIADILPITSNCTLLSKLNITSEKIRNYINYISSFNPKWLHIHPSILILILEEMNKSNLSFPDSVQYIELTGEYISSEKKNYLSKQLNILIANNYGCNEVNYIACECKYGNMHIMTDNVKVEIVKDDKVVDDGTEGEIIVTGLHNKAMPFIRYRTGDIGTISNKPCPCGCQSPILHLTPTRKTYYISTKSGPISSAELTYIIERVNERLNNCILQYQVIQNSLDSMQVYIILKPHYSSWKESVAKCFKDSIISDSLKSFAWEFYFPSSIYPNNNTGKVSYFTNNVFTEN